MEEAPQEGLTDLEVDERRALFESSYDALPGRRNDAGDKRRLVEQLLTEPRVQATPLTDLRHAASHKLWSIESYARWLEWDDEIDHEEVLMRMLTDLAEEFVWGGDPDRRTVQLLKPEAWNSDRIPTRDSVLSFAAHFRLDIGEGFKEASMREHGY